MALLPVQAFAVSATLQPKTIEALFAPDAERVRVTKTMVVVRYRAGDAADGWAVAHDFGALVFIGVPQADSEQVMRAVVQELGEEPRAPLQETFAVEVAPGATPAVRFDRVVVGSLDARVVEILSLVVAQSVAMEYYEGDLDALVVGGLEERSRRLATHGSLRGGPRAMVRFIGQGMLMHSKVLHTLSLLESPGATWDDEALDRMYRGLRGSFEIEERYRALDHELRLVQDNLALMVDLVRQGRYIVVEIAVAVFVAAELVILVFQVLLGLK